MMGNSKTANNSICIRKTKRERKRRKVTLAISEATRLKTNPRTRAPKKMITWRKTKIAQTIRCIAGTLPHTFHWFLFFYSNNIHLELIILIQNLFNIWKLIRISQEINNISDITCRLIQNRQSAKKCRIKKKEQFSRVNQQIVDL